ncbi:Glycogen synthase [Polystyrenella longa]|uniref:Glycogen synthase n=1 Tax=Polystyrenella longa TaxID=2528007 RepID=A0A518CRW2_9PLAN|nr:glycosyltransferase family 4 protein [Polystyrenella longa]QDU81950.1 Glycogen synthase [Polystyrenella longa]
MKVCLLTDTFFPNVGGAEMVLDHLARELVERGADVVVLAPKSRNAHEDQYPYQVERYRKPFSKHWGLRLFLPKLMLLHRRYQFDVIHCHAAYPQAYVARTFSQITGVPVVVRPHGSDILPGERMRKHPRIEERIRRTLQSVDAIIAQGDFLRDEIAALDVPLEKIHVIHNGVSLQTFATGEPYIHPRPYCLSLGNLSHRKGFDVLIRAFAKVDSTKIDLLIGGTGPEEEDLKLLITELGQQDRIHLVGHVSGQEKVNLYRSAEFFVCPSRREPFANVILEALASGLPIVATAVGGNSQLVRQDEHGLLSSSEDVDALAENLRRCIEEPDRLARYRAAVSDFVSQFDWPLVAGRYRALYEQVISARPSPSH